jgi:demethylmenaquinone methyltransferase/2-methoxy-6-polyprenyl-1,4-benzoquinol methylase
MTYFGFRKVATEEKTSLVKSVFSSVSKKYDLMNDLMSAGLHRVWKDKMIDEINISNSNSNQIKIIDVASGTCDIAIRVAKKLQPRQNFSIDVVDINPKMLDIGRARATDKNLFHNLNFFEANGENLPFYQNSFDFFTIAFGIRNFTNIDLGLLEAYRVLNEGGKFICLEFSKINDYFLQKIYDFYSFRLIPKIGKTILNDEDSYRYLVESIRQFPSQEKFKKMIENVGFKDVAYKELSFGVASIYMATKR